MEKKDIFKTIALYKCDTDSRVPLLLAEDGIHAGFPSPAQDYIELAIDLNTELIKNPASTFFGRVKGDCLKGAGVNEGDIVVIDKSLLPPKNGDMVVAFLDGEFTLKLIEKRKGEKDTIWLLPANDEYEPIKVTAENDFIVWGVVTSIIKQRKR